MLSTALVYSQRNPAFVYFSFLITYSKRELVQAEFFPLENTLDDQNTMTGFFSA